MPDTLQIVITVQKDTDEITISKCLSPDFDLDVMTEALASLIIVNGKYTELHPLRVLEAVHKKLENAVKFHGIIKRSE